MEIMERRVDLSKLPTKKYGVGTCIDWKKAVGQKIPFCYDNVRGELTIVEHQKGNYNDKVKREKAIKKGILENKYIELDCRYSKKEYLKKSLLSNSRFSNIYKLNEKEIDWDKCHEQGMRSMYIKIYKYKQENPKMTNRELANKFHVNKDTISKAINKTIIFYGGNK